MRIKGCWEATQVPRARLRYCLLPSHRERLYATSVVIRGEFLSVCHRGRGNLVDKSKERDTIKSLRAIKRQQKSAVSRPPSSGAQCLRVS